MNLLSIDKVINNFKEFLNYIDQQDEHICLVESLKTITNKEFVKDCNDVRAFLKVKQVNAGDIVVVYCDKNSYEYIMLLTGILSYGAICLPFEPSLLKRSGLTQEALKFNAKVIFVSKDSPMNGCCTINDFQKNSDYVPIHDVNDLTPAMVRQTSGTTGKSKNALIPQCSLLIYLNPNGTLYKNIMQEKYPNDFNVILFSPYTANVLCGLYFSIALGVTAYIEPMSILRNTALLTKRFNEIKPTLICAPQITLPLFYSLPLDTSNLKWLLNVGQVAIRDNGTIENKIWFGKFNAKGINVLNIYASAEASNILITSKPEDIKFPDAAGRVENEDIELNIINHELLVKSKYNLLGYYVNGKLLPAVDEQGYFHTNDEFETKDERWYINGRILNFSSDRQKLNPTYKNDAIQAYDKNEDE